MSHFGLLLDFMSLWIHGTVIVIKSTCRFMPALVIYRCASDATAYHGYLRRLNILAKKLLIRFSAALKI